MTCSIPQPEPVVQAEWPASSPWTIPEVLSGKTCAYLVQDWLGEGCFGKVARCLKTDTTDTAVAVKVLRKGPEALEDYNTEVSNIRFYDDNFHD